jgi:hypothetical protein
MPPRSTARLRKIVERAEPVRESDRLDEVAEAGQAIARAFDNFGRAMCCLAVKHEARNPGEQRELAAIMWSDVVSDFHDVPTTEEMRNWLSGAAEDRSEGVSKAAIRTVVSISAAASLPRITAEINVDNSSKRTSRPSLLAICWI